ncbi:MAG: LytTR family DNA-binding domain-containing protein [Aerococcus sp.]|nr:LytTR family DNA-binding domain-containing protein [Aerococcus sp.]
MKINECFGNVSKLEKMLSEWIDLPVSLNVRSAEAKSITFLFENFSEEEIVSFFKDNIQQTVHAVVGYRQDDIYGDILGKCDYQDVLYFEGIGDKVYAYADNLTLRLKNKLYEIEEFSKLYVRISKSFIVNILVVEKIYPSLNGKFIIELTDGQNLTVSRKYKKQFLEYLED